MITLDPWYTVEEYQAAVDALKYNRVNFNEYIDIRSKQWFIDIPSAPTHKYMTCTNDRYLVKTITVLDYNELAQYRRQPGTDVERFLNNDCIVDFSKSHSAAYAFTIKASDAQSLSKKCKVYWFGMYGNIGVGVSTCYPTMAHKVTSVPLIIGNFDTVIRKELFGYKYYLKKYTHQPYFLDGKFYSWRGKRVYDY